MVLKLINYKSVVNYKWYRPTSSNVILMGLGKNKRQGEREGEGER